MTEIVMPRLSDAMEDGTIISWLKSPGDTVAAGDSLVEIETDKATMTYEAEVAGLIVELVAAEGETLPVGSVLARLDEVDPGAVVRSVSGNGPDASVDPDAGDSSAVEVLPTRPSVSASPLARRVARRMGVELSNLAGTGPRGRIVRADVERAIHRPSDQEDVAAVQAMSVPAPSAPARSGPTTNGAGDVQTLALTRAQMLTARRMAESRAAIPHFSVSTEVDVGRAVAARERLKEMRPDPAPTLNDMVIRAAALALRRHPRANASFHGDHLELYSRINVGMAVAGDFSLVVPTVFDADRKTLGEIAGDTRHLAARARAGTITPAELAGGTFTVSNLGMLGVSRFDPIIYAPQAAILAVSAIREVGGGRLLELTLVCDHRVLYGADAARLLADVRASLEEPLGLAL
jgi:pyruvate dehydrogenase E2 component (dihydrolipoamide acetyltransferase)